MRKRLRFGLVLLGGLVLSTVVLYFLYPKEPTFVGKHLSEWVRLMQERGGPEREKARAAVRQLAPNSIPLLMEWLKEPEMLSLRWRRFQIENALLDFLHAHRPTPNFGPSHRTIAEWALPELDSAGRRTVIPGLIRMLGDKHHEPNEWSEPAEAAYIVLPKLAPESIQPLINALTNQDVETRVLAEAALGQIGPEAKAALPVLKARLKDPDHNVRVMAADTMGRLGGDPVEFVPVVIQSLPELKQEEIGYAADVLLRYKEHAKSAVPILLMVLDKYPESTNTINEDMRGEVTAALQQIDPAAADKADVK